jgi:hypothetical protein
VAPKRPPVAQRAAMTRLMTSSTCPTTNPNPGRDQTIAIYNASVVNFYSAMGSLARFENKNILFYFEKLAL